MENARRGGATSTAARRERYGPHEPAGTFEMTVTAVRRAVGGGLEAQSCLVEFAVWRNRSFGALLWFRSRKTMAADAAMAVRALEVWTDPDDVRCPSRVVFLNE